MSRRILATAITVSETSGSCSQSRTRRLLRIVRTPKACSTRQRSGTGTNPRAPAGAGRRRRWSRAGRHRRRRPRPRSWRRRPAAAIASRTRGAGEQRVDAVLVVQAGRRDQRGEQEPGRAGQDVALATVQPLAAVPAAVALPRAAAHAPRVDQAGPGLDGAAAGGARRRRERTGGGFPNALTAEAVPPPADGLPRREIPRQRPPAATLGHEVEASPHDLPDGGAHRPAARKEAGGQRPLRVGEIARVALADFVMDVSILCRPHVVARKMNSSSCENMGTVRSNRL